MTCYYGELIVRSDAVVILAKGESDINNHYDFVFPLDLG